MAWYSLIGRKLYIRIWLVVMGSVLALCLITGMAWQLSEQARLRHPSVCQVTVHDASGILIASETESVQHTAGGGLDFKVSLGSGSRQSAVDVEVMPNCKQDAETGWWDWLRPPYGFWWVLALAGIVIMACVLPLARRLTRQLEALQYSAERWEQGDLSIRCPESGDDEVADLTRHFNAAADRIATRIESHKSLLAYASHELRSPLARIRMAVELVPPGPAFCDMRAEIGKNIDELDEIVGKIMTVSRLEIRPNLFDAAQVDLIGLLAEECARAEIQATLDLNPAVTAHPAGCTVQGSLLLLRRAVRNLLENAVQHGKPANGPGQTSVHVEYEDAAEPAVLIHVDDCGPGVPADQRQHIFEPFYVLSGANTRGLGLGLGLVRMIAQRHGGSIEYSDAPGGGARFTLRLPCMAQSLRAP